VEQVRDGSTYRILLLPHFYDILFRLSAAQCPIFKAGEKEDDERIPEPYAREAKFFSENNILNREVQVTFDSLDKRGAFFGSMNYAGRNVADELLKIGLAKFTEWNANPADLERQKEFEKAAVKQGVRLWKGYVEPTIEEYLGKVREVQSSGNLVVSDLSVEPPVRRNVSLSSVMVPRFGVPGKDDEPWGWEAKEFLRKNLIGKKVRVLVDYRRAVPVPSKETTSKDADKLKTLPDRIYVTILLDKTNIALKLVEEGFARVVPHKSDEKRSMHYEALLIAEQAAKKKS